MDKLKIRGIKLNTLIGIYDWEKLHAQDLLLDITLQTNAKRIAEKDDIQQAIDYDKLLQHILAFVHHNHFLLIETLVEKIAEQVLEYFPTTWVQITLHKTGALKQADDVAITIERSK